MEHVKRIRLIVGTMSALLVLAAGCLNAVVQAEPPAASPVVLGHGVGLFKVGPLLAEDNFENLDNWVVQIQQRSGYPPAKVEARDQSLNCLLPGCGCTIWSKKKFPTRLTITYNVLCPTPKPAIKGVQPRDINNFWLATDPVDPDKGLFDSVRYTGKFSSYDKMHGYYASTGGGGAVANLTTRMRRYPREIDGKPAEHIALNDRDGQPGYLITPDKVMSVQLVAYDDVVQYIVDGKLNYQIARGDPIDVEGRDSKAKQVTQKGAYDLKRFPVYREGYFGFRMVGTHHIYTNFRVYALEPDDSTDAANVPSIPELRDTDFIHPGMLHNQAELAFIKQKVQAKESPWIDSWNQLLKERISSLDYKSEAIENVVRGPYEKPDIGAGDMERASGAAYSQAVQWVVTQDPVHAHKAIEIFNDYAYTLKSIGDNDAKLLVGMTGLMMLNAAEIIRHTSSYWTEPDQQQFEKMIRDVYYGTIMAKVWPAHTEWFPRANGNWDASMLQTMLCIAIFLDDAALFNRTVDYYINGETKGNIRWYINGETGQCQETGRDQHHTFMGIGFLAAACEIARKQGVDLYSAYDNRLALGFEYTAKYNLGFDVPFEPHKTYDGRIVNTSISNRGRGSFYPMWEKVYHHYHDRMGMEMPYTKQVLDKVRPQRWYIKFPVGQSLMYQNLPAYPKGYAEALGTTNNAMRIAQATAESPAADAVIVSTLAELREAVQKSNQTSVLKPGRYSLADLPSGSRNIPCSGSNNTIRLSGVYVTAPVGSTSRSYITISGDDNTFQGGVFEDLYPSGLEEVTDFSSYNQNRSTLAKGLRGAAVLAVTGDNNTVVGVKLTVRGAFPYGYGSIYGIGSDNVYGLDKRCGIVVKGESNTLDGCEIQQRAFGHGIYIQPPADKTVVRYCLVEGRMRLSAELYEETDPKDLPARSNYRLPRSGNRPVPKDVMLPLSEDGIRVYTRGGSVRVDNCTVKKMRGGIRLYLSSRATVTNSKAIDCGSTNFNMPDGGKITGSVGNFAYGPLSDFRLSRSRQDIELTILPSPHAVGPHNVADVLGNGHNIVFHRSEGPVDANPRSIVVAGDDSTIRNETEYPIILEPSASGNTVASVGPVTDLGANNSVSRMPAKNKER